MSLNMKSQINLLVQYWVLQISIKNILALRKLNNKTSTIIQTLNTLIILLIANKQINSVQKFYHYRKTLILLKNMMVKCNGGLSTSLSLIFTSQKKNWYLNSFSCIAKDMLVFHIIFHLTSSTKSINLILKQVYTHNL